MGERAFERLAEALDREIAAIRAQETIDRGEFVELRVYHKLRHMLDLATRAASPAPPAAPGYGKTIAEQEYERGKAEGARLEREACAKIADRYPGGIAIAKDIRQRAQSGEG